MSQTGDSEESDLGAAAASSSDAIAGHIAADQNRDSRLWRSVVIGEQEHRIDMKCIEPYKRVISHGGNQTPMLKNQVSPLCFIAFNHLISADPSLHSPFNCILLLELVGHNN